MKIHVAAHDHANAMLSHPHGRVYEDVRVDNEHSAAVHELGHRPTLPRRRMDEAVGPSSCTRQAD